MCPVLPLMTGCQCEGEMDGVHVPAGVTRVELFAGPEISHSPQALARGLDE